jgi:hypothetical protein
MSLPSIRSLCRRVTRFGPWCLPAPKPFCRSGMIRKEFQGMAPDQGNTPCSSAIESDVVEVSRASACRSPL